MTFTDLSKAFDSINLNTLVARLGAYDFLEIVLQFLRGYMKNHKKRVNVNSSFNEWETILTSVAQGSVLGLLLLNILLNGLFLVATHSHLSSYADDNTLDYIGNNINVNDKLRIDLAQIMEWFNKTYMVLNTDKGMCLGH